jgi:hypothetical protein
MTISGLEGLPARAMWLALALPAVSGCITTTMYVDPKLPVVRAEDLKPAAPAGAVQLMFEFRTRGLPNSVATTRIKPIVMGAVGKTGLFSQVSDAPVPDGRTLTIVIDNVRLDDKGAAEAFGVGLTFGLAGTTVSDGYVCNATYRPPGGKANTKTVKHAIHSTIGNASGPPGIPPMQPREAVTQVMEQLTLNALQELAKDGF